MTPKLKIALSGAQGTGKTSALSQLQMKLTAAYSHLVVRRLPEVARGCPWPVNEDTSPEAQEWIFHEQMALELSAGNQADILLCDRSALDNLIYAAWAAKRDHYIPAWEWASDAMIYFQEHRLATYNKIWFLSPGHPLADDGFRSLDKKFQAEIHALFRGAIKAMDFETRFETRFEAWPGLDAAWAELQNLVETTRLEAA